MSTETISGNTPRRTGNVGRATIYHMYMYSLPHEIELNIEYHDSGTRKADYGVRKKMIRNDIRLLIYMKHDSISN